MHYSLTSLSIIAAAFVLAGMVKGMIGMGLPTVAMGLLGLVISPAEAVALLVLPTLCTNVWQLAAGTGARALLARFSVMTAALFLGSFFGVRLLADGALAAILLGVVLAGYGALGLSAVSFSISPSWERRLSPFTGLVTGMLYSATGVGAIPAVPYLNSLGLDKDMLIQSLGLTFTVCSLGTALGLVATGRFEPTVAGTSIFAMLPAFSGMLIGQRLRNRLKAETFRRWFFLWMTAIGVYMIVHACK